MIWLKYMKSKVLYLTSSISNHFPLTFSCNDTKAYAQFTEMDIHRIAFTISEAKQ